MRKFIKILVSSLVIALITGCIFSSTTRRMIWYNFADVQDYRIFPTRILAAAPTPFSYAKSLTEPNLNPLYSPANGNFSQFCQDHNTLAFLVIKNDSICYEKYHDGYADSSIVPSFSVAKSITSLLIGKAIEDGFIKSVQEPITNYIPEMRKEFQNVTIEHVLQMTSGIAFNESYINPLGEACQFYYGDDLQRSVRKLKLAKNPGAEFNYVSGNTQILGQVLKSALKGKSVTAYLQEKIWTPAGMEFPATWSLDNANSESIEKTFCCLNGRAKDFAKIGSLMLHNGYWNGQQIINKDWIALSTKANTEQGGASFYKYQWWLPGENDFMAVGILGQYIYVNPAKNIVIVRLGKNEGGIDWGKVFIELSNKL